MKKDEKYILIEASEEPLSESATAWRLWENLSVEEIRATKIERVVVERFAGTRFFRMPAEKYFGDGKQ